MGRGAGGSTSDPDRAREVLQARLSDELYVPHMPPSCREDRTAANMLNKMHAPLLFGK